MVWEHYAPHRKHIGAQETQGNLEATKVLLGMGFQCRLAAVTYSLGAPEQLALETPAGGPALCDQALQDAGDSRGGANPLDNY
eukprot:8037599-Pyramimonas_sp.AAC.1